MIDDIDPHTACVVLWHFGERNGTYPPSSGIQALLTALTALDTDWQNKIGQGLPGMVAAVQIAQRDGLSELREIAGIK